MRAVHYPPRGGRGFATYPRADLATSAESAAASLADGAHLAVYNVTHVLMTALRALRA